MNECYKTTEWQLHLSRKGGLSNDMNEFKSYSLPDYAVSFATTPTYIVLNECD